MTAIHFVNLLSIICNVFLFGLCCTCTALAYGKAKARKSAELPTDKGTEQETSKPIGNSCEASPFSEPSAMTVEEEWDAYKDRFLKARAVQDKLGLTIEADTLMTLRNVLRRTNAETTLEDYVGNILIDHLGTHPKPGKEIADKQEQYAPTH